MTTAARSTARFFRVVRPATTPTLRLFWSSLAHDASYTTRRTIVRCKATRRWRGHGALNCLDKCWSSTLAVKVDDSTPVQKPVRILYGSQGGTAQLFAMQLADAISEVDPEREVSILGLHESSTPAQILDSDALNVFFVSCAGIGEPPDNARKFYDWLMEEKSTNDAVDWSSMKYAIFGLGNKQAHPNHFNVVGKSIDSRMEQLGANRIHETGLGDDSDCIEDDCDVWVESLVAQLTGDGDSEAKSVESDSSETSTKEEVNPGVPPMDDDTHNDLERHDSSKYSTLVLRPAETEVERSDLFHLQTTTSPFYHPDTRKMRVRANGPISVGCGEYGLREMCISLEDHPDTTYETGDQIAIYPRNSECVVDAYLQILDVDPHAVIEEDENALKRYPHPTGLTLRETLSHCVDLGAVPSPSFSRELLQRKDINYKEEIFAARRTALDIIYETHRVPTLEQLLMNLPPMKPRYYSIASSSLLHPREVYITYRPVKYVNSRGMLREGVCTSYLSDLGVTHNDEGHEENYSFLAASINSNPGFRLPKDPASPILLMAGGCGVAPIRAFLEERIATTQESKYGDGHLFLGFRNPSDEVYRSLVDRAEACGAITTATITYASGCVTPDQKCGLVSEAVEENGEMVYDAIQRGAYIYLCGGARTFGVAIENVLHGIFEEQGNMSPDEATKFMRGLSKEGRLLEDLAD